MLDDEDRLTEGPWTILGERGTLTVESFDPEPCCLIARDLPAVCEYVAAVPLKDAANARLIAASRELLAALNGLCREVSSGRQCWCPKRKAGTGHTYWCDQALAAVKKAEGR